MSYVAKIVPFLPLVFLLLGVYLYAARQKDMVSEYRRNAPLPTSAAMMPVSSGSSEMVAQKLKKLNLNGPMVCDYRTPQATVSASILNANIALTIDEATVSSSFLLRDDCLYTWGAKQVAGEKVCGIGQSLNMLRMVSSMGILDVSMLLQVLPKEMQTTIASNEAGISAFVDSCQDINPKENAFELPQTIEFIERRK